MPRSPSLSAVRTHLRLLVAGLMLAALASLVLHGAAMGAHGHGRGGASSVETAHALHGHHHGVEPRVAAPDEGSADADEGGFGAICGCVACSVTLPAPSPGAPPIRAQASAALVPADESGSVGAHPGGVRRPPRTLRIA